MNTAAAIPAWVFFVFFGLLAIGYRQSLPRRIKPQRMAAIAVAMFALSLYGVISAFGALPLPLFAWSLGIAISVALGDAVFGPHGLRQVDNTVEVPGSWWPLALMMGIFAAKFVLGFATGVRSPIVHDIWFIAAASLAFGVLSGGFTARALVVHRFVRRPAALAV
jgi:hypothetical protein